MPAFLNPAEAEFWVAYRGGEPVGRISAQMDRLHLETHRDATGHFGFLDAIDDPALFSALLATAEEWLLRRGLTRAVGPLNFSLWHEAGVLIEGFDSPPYVMMGHALPYFSQHIAAAGYTPAEDLIAYSYGPESPMPPAGIRIVERAMRKGDLSHHSTTNIARPDSISTVSKDIGHQPMKQVGHHDIRHLAIGR